MTERLGRRTSTLLFYREITEQLGHIRRNIHHHTHLLERIMSNQEHLDADVNALTTQFAQVQAEIENLKNQPGAEALDFTGLDAVVQSVTDAVPDQAPAPADTGDQPVEDGT